MRGEPALLPVLRPSHRTLSAGGGSQTIQGAGDSFVECALKVRSAGGDADEPDEEMDGGTDYANNYFDNGEEYLDDEDDNLDEGGIY